MDGKRAQCADFVIGTMPNQKPDGQNTLLTGPRINAPKTVVGHPDQISVDRLNFSFFCNTNDAEIGV